MTAARSILVVAEHGTDSSALHDGETHPANGIDEGAATGSAAAALHRALVRFEQLLADPDAGRPAVADSGLEPVPACQGGPAQAAVLTSETVAELARCYPDAQSVSAFFLRCGLPADRLPSFGSAANAMDFWLLVGEQLRRGTAIQGADIVLATAHADFPANPIFYRAAGNDT